LDVIEPEELDLKDGEYLVRKARESVEKAFINEEPSLDDAPRKLLRRGAPFVTINKIVVNRRELRGCIGYVKPVYPLVKAVILVAREAAFNDPRFPPLTLGELPQTVFEVSVLSSMREMPEDPTERLQRVKVGRMGLVVEKGFFSGLLLPQVPVEEGWDAKTFLDYTCLKAGMPRDCWKDSSVKVYYFVARVFEEEYPGGPVREKVLS
jgi:AmmeMemoRadiSam system protein A